MTAFPSTNDGSQVPQSSFMPILLSLLAGLSTSLGAAIVFLVERPKKGMDKNRRLGHREMSFSLSLAAAVMITVSLASILPECLTREDNGKWLDIGSSEILYRVAFFASGCIFFVVLSKLAFPEPEHYYNDMIQGLNDQGKVESKIRQDTGEEMLQDSKVLDDDDDSRSGILRPNMKGQPNLATQRKRACSVNQSGSREEENCHNELEIHTDVESIELLDFRDKVNCCRLCSRFNVSGADLKSEEARRAWRVTLLLFVSLAVHNFPEGLALAVSTMYNIKLGWTTTVAIALHNIPEGIAIAVPCLVARPESPCLAFGLASISGLFEPLGACLALVLLQDHNDKDGQRNLPIVDLKNILSFVAGIMIMVAVLDLFPEALRHSQPGNRLPLISGTVLGVLVMLGSEAYLSS